MKRLFLLILILVTVFTMCACGKKSSSLDYTAVIPNEAQAIDFSNSVTIVSSPTPVPVSVVTPSPVATPTSTPIPVSVATPVPTVYVTTTPTVVYANTSSNPITKSPYSDTVAAGGRVTFYATANNCSVVNWKIKDPDGSIYYAANAPTRYTGLIVSGEYTSKLELNNVPASMNNCKIQAIFTCSGTDYYSNNATLTVTGTSLDDMVKVNANYCHDVFATYGANYGYMVSAIQNYSVYEGVSDFNISFVKGTISVIGQFESTASRYFPTYVMVYDSGNIIGQKAMTSADPQTEFVSVLADPTGSFVIA